MKKRETKSNKELGFKAGQKVHLYNQKIPNFIIAEITKVFHDMIQVQVLDCLNPIEFKNESETLECEVTGYYLGRFSFNINLRIDEDNNWVGRHVDNS